MPTGTQNLDRNIIYNLVSLGSRTDTWHQCYSQAVR